MNAICCMYLNFFFNRSGEIHVARIRWKLSSVGLDFAPDKRWARNGSVNAYRLCTYVKIVQHWRTPDRLWRAVFCPCRFLDGRGKCRNDIFGQVIEHVLFKMGFSYFQAKEVANFLYEQVDEDLPRDIKDQISKLFGRLDSYQNK